MDHTFDIATMSANHVAVESLVDQCQHFIAMNLDEFPVSHLSLLPLKTREDLLWRLPIADLCLLEDTDFIKGIQDMAEYWKFPVGSFLGTQDTPDFDVACYFEQWDKIDYSKAILYGQIATAITGGLREDFCFNLPFGDDSLGDDDVIALLYTVKRPIMIGEDICGSEMIFPARYLRYLERKQFTKQEITAAVIRCFKGELPKILADIQLYDDVQLDYGSFLSRVTYIGIHGTPFEGRGLDFFKAVTNGSSHLEVLILEGVFCHGERISLDDVCSHLSSCLPFLPHFRLLKFLTCDPKYVVSREIFDELIMAYYSTPTDHPQKLRFIETKIKTSNINRECPRIDQDYLHFKVIELEDCIFVSKQKSTPKAIYQWLDQEISVLHVENLKENVAATCIFKVKKRALSPSRKRKYSEIDNEPN